MKAPPGANLYTTLAGGWGWVCGNCRAESRYVYGSRDVAVRLAARHDRSCKANSERGETR